MIYAVFGPKTVKNGSPYTDYDFVNETLRGIVSPKDELLLGGGKGLDEMAMRFALEKRVEYRIVPPIIGASDHESAFSRRNTEMIMDADKVLVFWDGKFRATQDLLSQIVLLRKVSIIFPLN